MSVKETLRKATTKASNVWREVKDPVKNAVIISSVTVAALSIAIIRGQLQTTNAYVESKGLTEDYQNWLLSDEE